jgi:ATP-dependent DNA ligase
MRPARAAGVRDTTGPRCQQPYPFFLAHPVDAVLADFDAALGPAGDWLVEWKYDGIRAQVVRRAGEVWIWSRGEELVTDRFPEVVTAAQAWSDGTVIDGEILAWPVGGDRPAPFNLLQQRIGRKNRTKKILADARPSAYDLLGARRRRSARCASMSGGRRWNAPRCDPCAVPVAVAARQLARTAAARASRAWG